MQFDCGGGGCSADNAGQGSVTMTCELGGCDLSCTGMGTCTMVGCDDSGLDCVGITTTCNRE